MPRRRRWWPAPRPSSEDRNRRRNSAIDRRDAAASRLRRAALSSGAFSRPRKLAKHFCNSHGKYRSCPVSNRRNLQILAHSFLGRRRASAGAQMRKRMSLPLGIAAAMAAAAGAQAADMPVKAKPVQYVKICSLYGDGFYYIPGTDTCLKLGGYLRVQAEYNAGNGGVAVGTNAIEDGQARFTRDLTNDINYRVRALISWDVRQQSEYGALRTYVRFGAENNTPGFTGAGTTPSPYWDRAFLQFAGFTVGRTRSFFDIFTYRSIYTYTNVRVDGDTDISGQNLWAYTAELGNGFSTTLSLEDPATHKAFTFDATAPGFFGLNGSVINDNAFTINNA